MRGYPWSCSDRMCGAEDCNLCRPGNESWQEWKEAQEEAEDRAADHAMERAKDDAITGDL